VRSRRAVSGQGPERSATHRGARSAGQPAWRWSGVKISREAHIIIPEPTPPPSRPAMALSAMLRPCVLKFVSCFGALTVGVANRPCVSIAHGCRRGGRSLSAFVVGCVRGPICCCVCLGGFFLDLLEQIPRHTAKFGRDALGPPCRATPADICSFLPVVRAMFLPVLSSSDPRHLLPAVRRPGEPPVWNSPGRPRWARCGNASCGVAAMDAS